MEASCLFYLSTKFQISNFCENVFTRHLAQHIRVHAERIECRNERHKCFDKICGTLALFLVARFGTVAHGTVRTLATRSTVGLSIVSVPRLAAFKDS